MDWKQRPGLLSIFRRDRIAGAWLALLLLFVPFVQPMSEANAAGKPFAAVICSTFGVPGAAVLPGLADDCPACIAGQHTPQFTVSAEALPAEMASHSPRSAAADFSTGLNPPFASSRWEMKPPCHAPPFSI